MDPTQRRIITLAALAGALVLAVGLTAASAVIAYGRGYVAGLAVAERITADRVVAGVEIASALRQNQGADALTLAEMDLDTQALLLRSARSNVGIIALGGAGPRPARAIVLATRYRRFVPPEGPLARDVTRMLQGERDDPSIRSTPRLATLAARSDAR